METKTEPQKINRIKTVLAETGHIGKGLAEQLCKAPRHRIQMVHQYISTGFVYIATYCDNSQYKAH